MLLLKLLFNLVLLLLHLLIGLFLLDLLILLFFDFLVLFFLFFFLVKVAYLLLNSVFLGLLVLQGSCSGLLDLFKLFLLFLSFFVAVFTLALNVPLLTLHCILDPLSPFSPLLRCRLSILQFFLLFSFFLPCQSSLRYVFREVAWPGTSL